MRRVGKVTSGRHGVTVQFAANFGVSHYTPIGINSASFDDRDSLAPYSVGPVMRGRSRKAIGHMTSQVPESRSLFGQGCVPASGVVSRVPSAGSST